MIQSSKLADVPEALVVSLARTGDDEAFAELVRHRQSWIRNLMRRCCGDPVLGDDLAQQVFLKAYQDLPKLRDPKKFAGWLKALALNVWRGHLRKNDALRGAEELEHIDSAHTESAGVKIDLESALESLQQPGRSCVVLSFYEGMSHGEIARHLGLPLGTVKSHIRRGTRHLHQLLDAYALSPVAETQS